MSVITENKWIDVCKVSDIPPLGSRVLERDGVNIAIMRAEGDEIFAIEDKCPHKQGPLSQGIIHGKQVTCPLHNWVLELATGKAVAPDIGCVKIFEVKQDGENVFLKL